MSYDLKIWSTNKIEPTNEIKIGDHVIIVDSSVLVEDEDIPTFIMLSRKTTKYLTEIHIQPFTENQEIITAALKIAKKLAKSCDGSIENPQEEGNNAINGKFGKEKNPETVSIVWYMSPIESLVDKYLEMISIFEKYMPNALPRRYGDYEPPQYKYEQTGKDHFVKCLKSSNGDLVWYASNPIQYVYISDAFSRKFPVEDDFRSNKVELIVFKKAFLDSIWNKALIRLFKEVALILNPFYAEIIDTEESEVISWWWKGLPHRGGIATIIGKPYLDIMPGITKRGVMLSDNLVYIANSEKVRFPRKFVFKETHIKINDILYLKSKKLENGKYITIIVIIIYGNRISIPIFFQSKKSLNPNGVAFKKYNPNKHKYAQMFPFEKPNRNIQSNDRYNTQRDSRFQEFVSNVQLVLILTTLFTVISLLTGFVYALGMSLFYGFDWILILFGPLLWGILVILFIMFRSRMK